MVTQSAPLYNNHLNPFQKRSFPTAQLSQLINFNVTSSHFPTTEMQGQKITAGKHSINPYKRIINFFLYNQNSKQVNVYKYSFSLVQALARMKQNNSLYLTLYRSIVSEIHKLKLNQMAVLLWSMVKVEQVDRGTTLAIYKKLYKIIQNGQVIKLYRKNQSIAAGYKGSDKRNNKEWNPFYSKDQNNNIDYQNQQNNDQIHYISESNFVLLVWAIQRTNIIDEKLILELIKTTFQKVATTKQNAQLEKITKNNPQKQSPITTQQQQQNTQKIRIENLCLLMYSITQLQLQKYRVSALIINNIMKKWKEFQKLSILTLVLLCQSFSKFVYYHENYLIKYSKKIEQQQFNKKKQYINKQKNFILFIVEAILLRQKTSAQRHFSSKLQNKKYYNYQNKKHQINQQDELTQLQNPLSQKFASLLIFNLSRLNLYEKTIWYKILRSITYNVDNAETQDLTMALSSICNLQLENVPQQDYKSFLFQQKKILCKRIFQIYPSLTGKSLSVLKKLIYQKKIQTQLVPSRIRKIVQAEYNQKTLKKSSQQKNQNEVQNVQESQNKQNLNDYKSQRRNDKYNKKNYRQYKGNKMQWNSRQDKNIQEQKSNLSERNQNYKNKRQDTNKSSQNKQNRYKRYQRQGL